MAEDTVMADSAAALEDEGIPVPTAVVTVATPILLPVVVQQEKGVSGDEQVVEVAAESVPLLVANPTEAIVLSVINVVETIETVTEEAPTLATETVKADAPATDAANLSAPSSVFIESDDSAPNTLVDRTPNSAELETPSSSPETSLEPSAQSSPPVGTPAAAAIDNDDATAPALIDAVKAESNEDVAPLPRHESSFASSGGGNADKEHAAKEDAVEVLGSEDVSRAAHDETEAVVGGQDEKSKTATSTAFTQESSVPVTATGVEDIKIKTETDDTSSASSQTPGDGNLPSSPTGGADLDKKDVFGNHVKVKVKDEIVAEPAMAVDLLSPATTRVKKETACAKRTRSESPSRDSEHKRKRNLSVKLEPQIEPKAEDSMLEDADSVSQETVNDKLSHSGASSDTAFPSPDTTICGEADRRSRIAYLAYLADVKPPDLKIEHEEAIVTSSGDKYVVDMSHPRAHEGHAALNTLVQLGLVWLAAPTTTGMGPVPSSPASSASSNRSSSQGLLVPVGKLNVLRSVISKLDAACEELKANLSPVNEPQPLTARH